MAVWETFHPPPRIRKSWKRQLRVRVQSKMTQPEILGGGDPPWWEPDANATEALLHRSREIWDSLGTRMTAGLCILGAHFLNALLGTLLWLVDHQCATSWCVLLQWSCRTLGTVVLLNVMY